MSSTGFVKTQLGQGRGIKCISFLPLSPGVYTDDPSIVQELLGRLRLVALAAHLLQGKASYL